MIKGFVCGRLTRDAEIKTTKTGEMVCNFTVAASKARKSKNGENAEYVLMTLWGERAKRMVPYLLKGKVVHIVGEMSVDAYVRKDGEAIGVINMTVDDLEFGPGFTAAAEQQNEELLQEKQSEMLPDGFVPVDENELPFDFAIERRDSQRKSGKQ